MVRSLQVNGCDIYDDAGKATALSQYYTTVYTIDDGNVPHCNRVMPRDTFTGFDISERDVVRAIYRMNADSAPGIDCISPKFLKNVFPYLVKPLHKMFTLSFHTGYLPSDWKKGVIVPIYKKNGKPHFCESYRPICLTSCVAKIFERIIYEKLLKYLKENEIISTFQHGFLSKRSTVTNLLKCTYDWATALDKKQSLDILYIDFEKAFDKVSHDKLIVKLENIGIGGDLMNWLSNFIRNRTQCVKINQSLSPFEEATSGIAQGTLLGPLLFILFINDLSSQLVSPLSRIELYADDSKLYADCSSVEKCIDFYEDILNVEDWCNQWQLKVNTNKCDILHVGKNNLKFPYRLRDTVVPEKNFCKDLGITISNDLRFRKHCESVAKIAHFKCRQFSQTFSYKDRNFLVTLFSTYIRPIIEYNTSIWNPYYIHDVELIENVQRKFTKFLPGLFYKPYHERLSILSLKTLEERRIFIDLILLYKIIHQLIDIDFHEHFSFAAGRTRGHSYKLYVNCSRINCHKYHFFNRIVNVWNSLPSDVVLLVKLCNFKTKIFELDLFSFCIGCAKVLFVLELF